MSRPSRVREGGILLVDKPAGMTSAAVVAVVKRALGGAKVGHLGTLDPFATGLLPLCIGEGTKSAPYLNLADKAYSGVVRLGVTTDTLDGTGRVIARDETPELSRLDMTELAARFLGEIEQVPPAFSAIKQGGRRSYELARRGQAVELPARRVRIHRLVLAVFDQAALTVEVECSKGTYIRSLARDIGAVLGCGAILEALRRTAFGPFGLAAAAPLDSLRGEGAHAAVEAALIPLLEALGHLRLVEIDAAQAKELRQGRQAVLARIGAPRLAEERVRLACGPQLVALAAAQGGGWRLERVFAGG